MLDFLVEQKLAEAVSRGEFDNLPGAGRPLDLDDDKLVPEELRIAYRILKNAGYSPEDKPREKAVKKLALLRTRIAGSYYEKALAKLAR